LVVLVAAAAAPTALSASTQILYGSDWAGQFKVLAVDPAGIRGPADVSVVRARCASPAAECGFVDVSASPNGLRVAFGTEGLQTVLIRSAYGTLVTLKDVRSLPTWRPDSRRLAYIGGDGLHVAAADGLSDRLVDPNKEDASPAWRPGGRGLYFVRRTLRPDAQQLLRFRNGRVGVVRTVLTPSCQALAWSADGRFLSCAEDEVDHYLVRLLDARGVPLGPGRDTDALPVWSPTGARLALGSFRTRTGVEIVDAQSRRVRSLRSPDDAIAVDWAPNGRSVAYLARGSATDIRRTGDIHELTLRGKLRTLVSANGPAGGTMTSLRWTRSPGATAWPTLPVQDGRLAEGSIEWLATAGDRVAYVACALPFVWSPDAGSSTLLPPPINEPPGSIRGCRRLSDRQRAEGIAIDGRAALYDWCNCPMAGSRVALVDLTTATASEAGSGTGTPGPSSGTGTVLGDASLLVFSGWESHGVLHQSHVVTHQWIRRVDGGGCPCPVIAEAAGRMEPLDVDQRRIVAQRNDDTVILDANGAYLLALPVTPVAAQLSGNQLVVLLPRELREYDASTGALVRSFPFGPISLGRECQGWFDPGCFVGLPSGGFCDITGFFLEGCGFPEWRLEDLARGLVTYVSDDKVQLLRLRDGAEATVAYGSLSRFTASGLVYVDGARLHVVPFDALPLR
jgi:hypothetical protein